MPMALENKSLAMSHQGMAVVVVFFRVLTLPFIPVIHMYGVRKNCHSSCLWMGRRSSSLVFSAAAGVVLAASGGGPASSAAYPEGDPHTSNKMKNNGCDLSLFKVLPLSLLLRTGLASDFRCRDLQVIVNIRTATVFLIAPGCRARLVGAARHSV